MVWRSKNAGGKRQQKGNGLEKGHKEKEGMAENPPGEKLFCTSVFRSLIQKTSSIIAGIAINGSLLMLQTVIMQSCHFIIWLKSESKPLVEVKKLCITG